MITIISGTPGAGKTLYTIEKLVLPLVGKTITGTDANGDPVEVPRTIYTNINGLQIDHELIDGGENQGLRDWHKWAKPGSVIVFDEVQKVWPPRANGSKVPEDIQTLDTHRHMGVDFILITQNVVNIDKHIHALGGRHLHVRRIANMPLAIVYEWDHVSRGLMFSKSLTKSPWRYDKKVFKLYKSAQLHTKQPRRLPGLVWFILIAIIAMVILAPTLKARMEDRFNGQAKPAAQQPENVGAGGNALSQAAASSAAAEPAFIDDRIAFIPRVSNRPETAPAYDSLRVVVNMPQVAGAVCFKGGCKCLTQQGTDAGLSDGDCRDWMKNPTFDNYRKQPEPQPPSRVQAAAEPSEKTAAAKGVEVVPMASTSINARVADREDQRENQYLQGLSARNAMVRTSIN
ncbi:zonular occludens toxin domain-containing protein [Pantoea sp. 18069]|uniref:zonular occludens toxin domain-containing protein n=1 Tax=Pantoea sp. 18069 TaxID=2681415 RepID=UPI00135AF26B|nr:zonular occludens toxin domain-containing protein [Pantoea sp. 18069]